MNSVQSVFSNDDLRRFILKFIIYKRCNQCHDIVKSNSNTCVSCIWQMNNPNLNISDWGL